MKLSPWRLAHLWLALISGSFLIIASVTGAILSFEPVYENSHPYQVKGADDLALSQVMETIKANHEEVMSLTRDENGFVALTSFEYDQPVYIDPFTTEVIGEGFETPEIFEFCRTLHRSLFLGKTGRFLMGITALFLIFISISGIWLVVQKQGGWKKILTPVVKNDFFKDYHTRLGRLSLLVLLVISLTGTYLFLNRFEVVPVLLLDHQPDATKMVEATQLDLTEFPSLDGVTLSALRELNFPFAEDPEEFYELKLNNRELLLNQFNGEVVSQIDYPLINLMHDLSFTLHTGEGTVLWAIVLGLSALAVLFFIYSGLAIFFKRGMTKTDNPFDKNDCEYVLLVGSEQGSTFRFAHALHKALIAKGLKSHLCELNAYEPFEKMQKMLVLTATYGLGEATTNARQFLSKLEAKPPTQPLHYAVLGFGSTNYPDFCQFAIEVEKQLVDLPLANPLLDLQKVNNADQQSFLSWVDLLGTKLKLDLKIDTRLITKEKVKEVPMLVKNRQRSPNDSDATFLLELATSKKALNGYKSGDLLSIVPEGSDQERLYSMSVDTQAHTVLLSVRKHEHGLCSNYLSGLQPGENLRASFRDNHQFKSPKEAPGVIMIANGTGIAPFLGMIGENDAHQSIRLYWGGQNELSYQLYSERLNQLETSGKLESQRLAFSRQGKKQYIQHLVQEDGKVVADLMGKGHVVMLCGALAMQKATEAVLEDLCQTYLDKPLSHYKEQGQIKADCY